MIRGDGLFRTLWDALILALLLVGGLIIPYQVAFVRQVLPGGSLAVYLIDAFFLADILLNFRTTYRQGGVEVRDRRRVARRYLRRMFLVDCVASLPLDLLFLGMRDELVMGTSIVLLLRLLRMLRIVRLFVIFRRWEQHGRARVGLLRIARVFALVVLLVHLIACAWFYVPFAEEFPADSWPVREGVQEAGASTQYLRSLYWAVVTMTTVGYGDITPGRDMEYVFTIIVILLGASLYAFVIGNIASHLSNLDAVKTAFRARTEAVSQYLRSRQVPSALSEQVRAYYEYVWHRHRGLQADDLLSDLPAPVRLDIVLHLTRDLLSRVPLFRSAEPALRNALLLTLRAETYGPEEYVVRKGEAGHEIYFVAQGELEIFRDEDSAPYGRLQAGDHFGDLSLLLKERRTASVRTVSYCDLLVLRRADFGRLRGEYPELKDVLSKVSAERSDRTSQMVLDGVVL